MMSNTVFGMANTVFDIINREQPTHVAVAFDTSEPTERHEVFAEYKAHRDEMPEDIAERVPDAGSDTERNWCYLARAFVNDIQGQAADAYQTFREGSLYQQLIDLIRADDGWIDVAHLQA